MAILTGFMLFDLLGILVAAFAVIYAHFQWNYGIWKRKKVPYFNPTFPFGNMHPLDSSLSIGDDIFNTGKKAKKQGWKYFGFFLYGKPCFVPLSLDITKCILAKDFDHFSERGLYYNEKDDPISANLFNIGGIKWRNLRTKLTPSFTSGKMKSMFQILLDCSALFENVLKQHDRKEPIDIKHSLACFTTDIIGSCAFGLECNSFRDANAPFVKHGKRVFTLNTMDQLRIMFTMSFPNLSKALHVKTTNPEASKFYYDIITKTINYRERNNFSRNDFLQLLMNIKNKMADEEGKETSLTMDEIVSQCFVFFLAGFETSSTTMTFALYELCEHPEMQEKVRQELFRVLKKYDNKICYDSLNELEYMQQVIDEALRKYPPGLFITRKCTMDYKIPNTDIIIEKDTDIIIPIKNIHYDEDIYEDPEKFDPERFNSENRGKRHPYAHMPFGEGPRICIGKRFGLMQTKIGLATILKHFRVSLSPKTKTPLEFTNKSFVPTIAGGLWLNLETL